MTDSAVVPIETMQPESDAPMPNVLVMVPSFNEEKTIGDIIREIPRVIPGVRSLKILVVDDGSQDRTSEMATKSGADAVLRHKINRGLGQTFKDGLHKGLELGADIIVSLDGDGQHDPKEIPLLLEPILAGRSDLVIGDRRIRDLSSMPRSKRVGNRLATWLIRRLSGLEIRDAQSGFRAVSRKAAQGMVLSGGYTYTQEMILQAASRGFVVEEVPISYRPRAFGDSRLTSSMLRYALRAGATILRSYRDHNPLTVFAALGAAMIILGGLVAARAIFSLVSLGTIGPYIPSAFFGAVIAIMGIQIMVFGLMADTFSTQRRIVEEILISLRDRAAQDAQPSFFEDRDSESSLSGESLK